MVTKLRIAALLLLLAPVASQGQAWSGIVDPGRAVDWSGAGIAGGIPNRTMICSSLTSTATAATINSAIASCPAGQVVFLAAGTYNLTTGIDFSNHSNVTLRGAGADQTIINFTGHTGCNGAQADVCFRSGENNWPLGPTHTANWTAGYAKGATVVTLSSTTGLAVGSELFLDQLNDSADTGNVWVCETGGTCAQEGPADGERSGRAQSQVVTVTGISGSNVTISPGLRMPNWRSGQTPGAWWGNTNITMSGIEDMSLNHTSGGAASGITFDDSYKCWVKGIRSIDPNRNHVWIQWSARIVVRDSYFFNTQNHQSQSYGVEPYLSSDNLFENNIFQQVTTPIQVNGSASGTVVGYNYTIDNVYTQSAGWMIAGNSLHAAGVDNVLFEGNEANAAIFDDIHGTHNFTTVFRNQYIGWEATKNTQTNAFQVYFGDRYDNLIGNVLGRSGYHNHYEDVCPSGTSPNTSIYVTGWFGNTGSGACDPLTNSTRMRWGNYDVVNAAVQWNSAEVPTAAPVYPNPVPGSHTLPASFYLASEPSWFGSVPYPPIGPDVTGGNISGVGGFAYQNPAQLCYLSIMGGPADGSGNVLNFNEASCYPTSPPAPSATISPSLIAFANRTANSGPSASQSFTLTNTGNATLSITSITLGGSNPSQFALTNGCGSTLAAGLSCAVGMTFSPTSVASFSATVTFVTNDPVRGTQVVNVTGSGVNASAPVATISPSSLSFGSQNLGSSSTGQTLTLTNTGNAGLTISSISLSGTNANQFSQVSNSCGSSLTAGSNCALVFRFTPTAVGASSANVVFVTNDPVTPSKSIPLSGTGVGVPIASLSNTNIPCGNVAVNGSQLCPSVTLTNTGTANLVVSNVTIGSSSTLEFTVPADNCIGTLAPNATCSVTPQFNPTAPGAAGATITFSDNASNSPQLVNVTGTGVASAVNLSATSVDCGSVTAGTSSPCAAVVLTNSGTSTLSITSITITGSQPFTQANGCPASLAVNQSCSITPTFAPSATGAAASTITINDNAGDSPQHIALTGTGTSPVLPTAVFSPTSVNCGSSGVGVQVSCAAVTLTNTGGATLNISSKTLAGTNPGDFSESDTCGATLTAGSFCTVTASFLPTTAGSRSAIFSVVTNAADSPESFSLAGAGTVPPPVLNIAISNAVLRPGVIVHR